MREALDVGESLQGTRMVQLQWEDLCKLQSMFAEGMKAEKLGPPNKAGEAFREGQGKKDGKKSHFLSSQSQAQLEAFACVNSVTFVGVTTGTLLTVR